MYPLEFDRALIFGDVNSQTSRRGQEMSGCVEVSSRRKIRKTEISAENDCLCKES